MNDLESGYVADVKYDGEAVYADVPYVAAAPAAPAPVPVQPSPVISYKPAPVPAYKPTPAPAYKPAPAPAYKPAPVPAYNPAPVPAYKPAPVPAYKPAPAPAYKPAKVPAYKPAPVSAYKPYPRFNQASSYKSSIVYKGTETEQKSQTEAPTEEEEAVPEVKVATPAVETESAIQVQYGSTQYKQRSTTAAPREGRVVLGASSLNALPADAIKASEEVAEEITERPAPLSKQRSTVKTTTTVAPDTEIATTSTTTGQRSSTSPSTTAVQTSPSEAGAVEVTSPASLQAEDEEESNVLKRHVFPFRFRQSRQIVPVKISARSDQLSVPQITYGNWRAMN